MKLIHNTLTVGLTRPVSFLHVSDTHLVYADERDDDRKRELAAYREPCFPGCREHFEAQKAYAGAHELPILHTGDLMDFVSEQNLDEARNFVNRYRVFMVPGNHDFSLYVGEAKEDKAYKMRSFVRVQRAFGNDLSFAVRDLGGVKLITMDNSYYNFEKEQYDRLVAETAGDTPVIVAFHTPLYEPVLFEAAVREHGVGHLVGVPGERMDFYPPKRREQETADAITLKTAAYIADCPQIKAVLAGHLHFDFESRLNPGTVQWVTGTDSMRHITVQ